MIGGDEDIGIRLDGRIGIQPIEKLAQVAGISLVAISALADMGLERLMSEVFRSYETWNRRVPTGRLNRWLEGILAHHPPPAVAGRRLKVKYVTQAKTRPPGFVVSCSRPEAMRSDVATLSMSSGNAP